MDVPHLMPLTRTVAPQARQEMVRHCQQWNGCKQCQFGVHGGNKVYYRGHVPAEVLFIAEAPSIEDHSTKLPMSSDPGTVMNRMILNSAARSGKEFKWCITMTVLCTPFNEARDIVTPKVPELGPCSYRLHEFVQIVKPKIIVRVGAVAIRMIPASVPIYHGEGVPPTHTKNCDMYHPTWISFTKDPVLSEKKMMFALSDFFKEHL